ncbi:MAG: hypothetical protein AAF790_07955 [Planctomycetota bacterium]
MGYTTGMACRLATLLIILSPVGVSVDARADDVLWTAPDVYAEQAAAAVVDKGEAARLLAQAQRAADAGDVATALERATQALAYDPDEPTCRRVLGYQRVGKEGVAGGWLTAFQAKQARRGYAWDTRYGWVKPADLPRYEAGERRDGRRWLSAEEDAARHATIATGWQVRTDHFVVTTNHSLQAAAGLAAELERLMQVWRQRFAGYSLSAAEVRERFAGTRTPRGQPRPFSVVYHRDKAGYTAALRHKQPRVGETLGIYFDDLREAHFYADPEADPAAQRATLYHEATHQLFRETRRGRGTAGAQNNFWAVEGVALYLESLTPLGGGRYAIGRPDGGRLPAARRRLLRDGYLTPLAEMASLGRLDLQRREDLAPLYSQMAGVATFLMQADGGRRRAAFVGYLRDLYAGKTRSDSLWRAIGASPDQTLAEYRQWQLDLAAAEAATTLTPAGATSR